jgi:hypothetical protein
MGYRYRSDVNADRAPLDRAYADGMRTVAEQYPSNEDVATLYAEAMMDLRPWDLWSNDGQPRPETPVIVETLERALSLDPRHPLAHHLLIHALEASPRPSLAVGSADILRTLVPG